MSVYLCVCVCVCVCRRYGFIYCHCSPSLSAVCLLFSVLLCVEWTAGKMEVVSLPFAKSVILQFKSLLGDTVE